SRGRPRLLRGGALAVVVPHRDALHRARPRLRRRPLAGRDRLRGLRARGPARRRRRRRGLAAARALAEVGVDERIEVAVEDGVGVPDLDARPEVLHHPVGCADVRADLVSEPDLRLAAPRELGELLVLLLLLELVEARLQDLHRHRLVLVLRAFVLAGDDDAGREVREPHGGVGLVDVLAAGAARAVRVDAEVLVPDLDLDVLLDVGKDDHRRERRLPARVRVEGRDADEAVDARLGAEVAEGVRALHHERGALDPRAFAGLLLEDLRLVPAPLRPAQVHPQQHLGPVLRLETARTGVDLDDRAAGVVLAAEELLE